MTAALLTYAVLGAVLASLGQVSFKWGATGRDGLMEFVNPWILLGLVLYLGGTASWIRALASAPLTVVYPFTALTYVLVNFMAVGVLGESLTVRGIAGTLLVLLGLLLMMSR